MNISLGNDNSDLLIYIQVPFFRDSGFFIERQAINGLRLWADNFDRVRVLAPLMSGTPPVGWLPVEEFGPALSRVSLHPLPEAYRPDRFLSALPSARRVIGDLIDKSDYLVFAIGGLFGDWGAVSAFEANRRGRSFAVWTDKVESAVTRHDAERAPLGRHLYLSVKWRLMAELEKYVIRKAALGLFHGRDTFDAYKNYSRNPHLVHDIHIAKKDHIDVTALEQKLRNLQERPLRILYAGRAHPMKGGLDWIKVLQRLASLNVSFFATWLGDGPDLVEMKSNAISAGLSSMVSFPGFVDDRENILNMLRKSDILLFCHKTAESPRVLIEALISATPIIGYHSAYAADLTPAGGGVFVPLNDIDGLALKVAELAKDRGALAQLIIMAQSDGSRFDDESVFRHRSELVKAHLLTRSCK